MSSSRAKGQSHNYLLTTISVRDFRLPARSKRSWFFWKILDFLTLEEDTDRWSRNVREDIPVYANIPELRRSRPFLRLIIHRSFRGMGHKAIAKYFRSRRNTGLQRFPGSCPYFPRKTNRRIVYTIMTSDRSNLPSPARLVQHQHLA